MLTKNSKYNNFLTFFRPLKGLYDDDTSVEDAFTTLYFNPQIDVVKCVITKQVKQNHMNIQKDENGQNYYEMYMADFTKNLLDFMTDFQILNSKGDVEYNIVIYNSGLPNKHIIKRFDVINCNYVFRHNMFIGIRFIFKDAPYPIQYSYTGYIFNYMNNTKQKFIENFGNDLLLCE